MLARELLRFGDFRIKQFRRHRAARNHAKTTSIADRRDKIAFRNPTHRPAHDCDVAAQKFRTARHKAVEFVFCHKALLRSCTEEGMLLHLCEDDDLYFNSSNGLFGVKTIGRVQHAHGKLRLGSEEHTSELQSLMRISYAVFCLTQPN